MQGVTFWREVGSLAPAALFMIAGLVVSGHDFLLLHERELRTSALVGAPLIIAGLVLELTVRLTLLDRAGFGSLTETKRLRIVPDHQLLTDGVFKYIRHPLYLGRIVLDFGIAALCSSFWGAVLMTIAALCFVIRIRIEEEMLVEEFGDAYRVYQARTKKLVPWIY